VGLTGGGRALLIATIAALAVVVAVPLVFVVLQAIFPALGRGSLQQPFGQFGAILKDPTLLRLTANTVLLGVAVVCGTALVGVPLGILRALFRLPFAPLWDVLMLIPFMIPPYIATLGWILTLQPRGYMSQLAGFHAGPFLFSFFGLVFVMVLHALPVVYFAVSRAMEAVGGQLADVGRIFGASPWTAFRRITLPLATPGIVASLLLVFAMSIEEYGTPAALGRQSGFLVLVTGIETRISDWPIDLAGAAILSLVLVGLLLTAFSGQARILAARSFETVGARPQQIQKRELGTFAPLAILGFVVFAVLAAGVPLAAILGTAFSKTISGGLSADNLGLRNFALVLDDQSGAWRALRNSVALGLATALITGLIGVIAGYFVVRTRFRGLRLVDGLTALPNAVPGIVVAVGLILAWNQPFLPVTPYNTPLILLLAYCCILLPYPARYANAAFRQIGDSLEAAARVSGASATTTLRRILLPLVIPTMISSMLLVFAIAARELVASILLAPPGVPTIGTFIWRQFEQGSIGLGMAMSSIAILLTTTISVAVTLLTRQFGIAK
jgi:iron(III) transport system permease protein